MGNSRWKGGVSTYRERLWAFLLSLSFFWCFFFFLRRKEQNNNTRLPVLFHLAVWVVCWNNSLVQIKEKHECCVAAIRGESQLFRECAQPDVSSVITGFKRKTSPSNPLLTKSPLDVQQWARSVTGRSLPAWGCWVWALCWDCRGAAGLKHLLQRWAALLCRCKGWRPHQSPDVFGVLSQLPKSTGEISPFF